MIKGYNPLSTVPLKTGTSFSRPTQALAERVKLSNPATDVMTDLNRVSLVTVRAKTPMEKANSKMIQYGVRMLLVIDDSENLVGLVTAADILGEKPVNFQQHMGCAHGDIMVRDIMSTFREVEVLNISDVRSAKVGDIVATLKKAHRQHALVAAVDGNGKQVICGLFSLTQIARQLGVKVHSFELADTLAEIEAAIAQGD